MADISSSRIGAIGDPQPDNSNDQAHQKTRLEAAAKGKPSPGTPEIGSEEEDDKPQLDEMA